MLGMLFVTLHVDYLISMESKIEQVEKFKEVMKEFEMTNVETMRYILGLEVDQISAWIFVSQGCICPRYTKKRERWLSAFHFPLQWNLTWDIKKWRRRLSWYKQILKLNWQSQVLDENKAKPYAKRRSHKFLHGGAKVFIFESTKADTMVCKGNSK